MVVYRDIPTSNYHELPSVFELNTMNVDDAKVHNDKEGEMPEVVFSETNSLFLRLKPSISINHKIENEA